MSPEAADLRFFDANCMLGCVIAPRPGFPSTVAELLAVMDYFGIAEALVYHSLSKEYHPAHGNSLLLEEIAGSPRLHAMWVVMPSTTGELPDEEELVAQMLAHNVRAARVFPSVSQHNFSLRPWSAGRLLAALASRSIPLFVEHEEIDWNTVHDICEAHPRLPLVLTSVNYRANRFLFPLCQRFPQIHVDLSWYFGHRGIEDLVGRFGAERLLFGTRLPYFTPGAAVDMLSYARISAADKQRIAGDNLRALLQKAGKP